jgi:TonB family protein
VLNQISEQTNLNLIFNDNLTNEKIISCNVKSTAEEAITNILKKNGFVLKKFNNNTAVIFKDKTISAKTKGVVRKSRPSFSIPDTNQVISKPILISKKKLEYPVAAMRDRLEGEVITKLLISKTGDVERVILERSSGFDILDTATINYVKRLKFLAAELNGEYRESWTSMVVKFNFE